MIEHIFCPVVCKSKATVARNEKHNLMLNNGEEKKPGKKPGNTKRPVLLWLYII